MRTSRFLLMLSCFEPRHEARLSLSIPAYVSHFRPGMLLGKHLETRRGPVSGSLLSRVCALVCATTAIRHLTEIALAILKHPHLQRVSDGETRIRTGDTTIFRDGAAVPTRRANRSERPAFVGDSAMTARRQAVAALAELPADTHSYRRVCATSQAAGHKPNQPARYGACAEQDRLSRVLAIVRASLLSLPKEIELDRLEWLRSCGGRAHPRRPARVRRSHRGYGRDRAATPVVDD
jgi:hypothetical protein